MDSGTTQHRHHPRYHSEFRLLIASTSGDTGPERERLRKSVLPELRRLAGERGIQVIDRDPRWEASMSPARSSEILAAHMEEMLAHRPVFIGILGNDCELQQRSATERTAVPWLRDMDADDDHLIATPFFEQAIGNQLMLERAFFYIMQQPGGNRHHGEGQHPPYPEEIGRLRADLRNGRFSVREAIAGPDELGKLILEDLLMMLDRMYPATEHLSMLQQLRRSHESFAAPHRRAYVELPGYFDRLDAHVAAASPPIFITGPAGAGKSALIANWAGYRRNAYPDLPIICHHVEATPVEGEPTPVLRHIMAELKELYTIGESLPETDGELPTIFPLWLEHVRGGPLVIIIDGLDHLAPSSHVLDWLPADLPPNVRLVVSTATRETDNELFGRLIDREWEELRIAPLTLSQQRAIVDRMVTDTGSELDADLLQRSNLADAISIPLFLRMSVRQIQNASTITDRNRLMEARTHEEFFEQMLEQLETRHGAAFVRDAMSLIRGARRGLNAPDLQQLTGADPKALDGLLAAIDHYLVNRDGLLGFIHEYVRRAADRRYLPSPAKHRNIHERLARYFATMPHSPRRASEEPWQWEQAGDGEQLAACLSGMEMFMQLSTEAQRHELLEYWVHLKDEPLMVKSYEESFSAWRSATTDENAHAGAAERLGIFFMTSGLYAIGESYLDLALTLKRKLHGDHHRETAVTLHHQGELLRQAGRYADAEGPYHAALDILERESEPDHTLIAQVLSDLGLLHREWGRHQSALPFYQRAVELKERTRGADHPATAESLNDLALLYHDLCRFDMAISLYRRALDIRERRLGRHHPATATTLNNLAGGYHDAGALDDAETQYRRALQIRERMLGRDHPHTLITLANIASLLRTRKKFPESRAMFERAIDATIARLGEDHPNTIALCTNYALLLRESHDYDGAEKVLQQALAAAQRTLGNTHPFVAACFNNMAVLLEKMERADEAAPLYERAIASWETSLGNDHVHIAGALEALGKIRLAQGSGAAAMQHIRRALDISMKALGPDHADTKRLQDLLAHMNAGE